MHLKYDNISKTLGPLAAQLVVTLYSGNRLIFHLHEAIDILGKRTTAASVLSQLINNGIVNRLKPGIFQLVPFELGFEKEYLGNPYAAACELALGGHQDTKKEFYLSYGSAFDLHQMVTQPQLIVYISSPRMIRSRIIQGTEFRFVRCKPDNLFGLTEIWVDKNKKIPVSDLERTLIDGLKHPAYCGGLSEVAKGFSIKHEVINPQKLIDYAVKLNVGAVNRRLGYLMELYQIGSLYIGISATTLTSTYQLLDPELPEETMSPNGDYD